MATVMLVAFVTTPPVHPRNVQPGRFVAVRVTRVLPMKEPDQALVNIKITNGYGYGDIYVYSFTQRSLAKLDRRQLPSDRLSFISSLGKYAVFDGMKIVLIDQLPTEPAIALNTMIDKLAWDRQIALAEALDSQNASSTFRALSSCHILYLIIDFTKSHIKKPIPIVPNKRL